MQPGSNSANRTILIVVFSCLALCCIGGGLLGFLGYRSGSAAAKEDGAFLEKAMLALSNDGYVFKDSQKYFMPIKNEIRVKQTQVALDAIREKLGKFESLGDVRGFYLKSGTEGTTHRVTYGAKFEKAEAVVQAVILNPGEATQTIYSWRIDSPVFHTESEGKQTPKPKGDF